MAGPKPRWPKMDWPKLDWPKLVKSRWPKQDWPKSVSSFHFCVFPIFQQISQPQHTETGTERDRETRKRKCGCGEDERQKNTKRREEKRRGKMKDEKIVPLSSNVQNLTIFSNCFHDPNSIFRVEGIISAGDSGSTASHRTRKFDFRVVSRDRRFREICWDVCRRRRCWEITWK